MPGVFISYRQSDSKAWAAFLRDELSERFAPEAIFLDRDTLHAGSWREQIEQALSGCNVTLVVIGRGWLDAADERGRRLDHPDDVHRNEVAHALRRSAMTVIPVLVDDATMPSAAQLPDELRALCECQAREFSDDALHRAVDLQALSADIQRCSGLAMRAVAAEAAPVVRYVPFVLDEAAARAAFSTWAGGRTMAPKDFAAQAQLESLTRVWWPFWRVDAAVTAQWSGRRGKTCWVDQATKDAQGQSKTERVSSLVWEPVQGDLCKTLAPIAFSALPIDVSDAPTLDDGTAPLRKAAALPDATVAIKQSTIDREAAGQRATDKVRDVVRELARQAIGGEKQDQIKVDIQHDRLDVAPVLYPVFEGRYRYAGVSSPVLIDGHSAAVGGPSPLSKTKIGAIVLVVLLVVAVIAVFVLRR